MKVWWSLLAAIFFWLPWRHKECYILHICCPWFKNAADVFEPDKGNWFHSKIHLEFQRCENLFWMFWTNWFIHINCTQSYIYSMFACCRNYWKIHTEVNSNRYCFHSVESNQRQWKDKLDERTSDASHLMSVVTIGEDWDAFLCLILIAWCYWLSQLENTEFITLFLAL